MSIRLHRGCGVALGLWLLAAVTAGAMGAAASKPAGGAGGRIEPGQVQREQSVTFRSARLPNPTKTSVDAKSQRAVLRAFLKEHPNINIKAFSMPAVGGSSSMDSGPLMAIAAGLPPHAIYVNFRQSSTYINHGFLTPLENLLARVRSDNPRVRQTDKQGRWLADPRPAEVQRALQDIRKRVADPTWPVVYRRPYNEQVGRQKHVWALPTSLLVRVLVYRKDLFYQAGLNPRNPPDTWKELTQYAEKLTVPSQGQYALMFKGGTTLSYGIYNFLVSTGARAMHQKENGQWEAVFNSREAAEAILYFDKLYQKGYVKLRTGSQGGMLWSQGRIAMKITTLEPDLLATLNPELVGLAPVPKSPSGERAHEVNSRMMGVFADSTPRQKLAIMEYLWYLTGDEAERIRTGIYVENGYGKFVNPDLLQKYGYTELLNQVPKGWRDVFHTSLKSGVPEPYGQGTQLIYRYMSGPIHRALDQPLQELPREVALQHIMGWLNTAAGRVNQRVLGKVPPEVMKRRRWLGGGVLALLVIGFVGAMVWVWRTFSSEETAGREQIPLRRFVWGYALLSPALVLLVLWYYLPLIGGAVMALLNYELVLKSSFVGVDHFAMVLFDAQFWASLGRTFIYVSLVIGLGFWPPILLAILLDEIPTETLKYIFRTVYYLPAIISGVIVVFLWKQLYDASEDGFLNQILLSLNDLGPVMATLFKWVLLGLWLTLLSALVVMPIKLKELSWPLRIGTWLAAAGMLIITLWPLIQAYQGPSSAQVALLKQNGADLSDYMGWGAVINTLGRLVGQFQLQALDWIKSPRLAMLCVVMPMVWGTAGPGCIIYLAALKSVPTDLYEAAAIDGAGIWQRVFYVTLPRLKFLIVIQFIAAVVAAFKGGTDFILALTGGGPNGATRVLSLDIFYRTFLGLNFGVGAAMAWLLGGILIIFTAYQLRMLARAEFRAANTEDQKGAGA